MCRTGDLLYSVTCHVLGSIWNVHPKDAGVTSPRGSAGWGTTRPQRGLAEPASKSRVCQPCRELPAPTATRARWRQVPHDLPRCCPSAHKTGPPPSLPSLHSTPVFQNIVFLLRKLLRLRAAAFPLAHASVRESKANNPSGSCAGMRFPNLHDFPPRFRQHLRKDLSPFT